MKTPTINKASVPHLISINLLAQNLIFQPPDSNKPRKLNFDEVIFDLDLLSMLSSHQAAWVGYYFVKGGKKTISSEEDETQAPVFDISSPNTNKPYRLMMVDRKSNVIYKNNETNTFYVSSPINAIMNNELIQNFPVLQACYIGMLAAECTVLFRN